MTRIIFDQLVVAQKTGLDARNNLLYPHMDLDSRGMSSPILIEKKDGSLLLIVKDIERGNFDEKKIKGEVSYYNPYFTFDGIPENTPKTWMELLQSTPMDDEIAVDGQVYMSAYRNLNQNFKISVEASHPWWRVYLYEIRPEDVLTTFGASYSTAQQNAKQIVSGLRQQRELLSLLERGYRDDRFSTLDAMLQEMNLETMVVSSPVNGQEITGVPFAHLDGLPNLVLYHKGGRIALLTPKPLSQSFPKLTGVFPDIETTVKSLSFQWSSAVGIEENHLSYDLYRSLGFSGNDQPVSAKLRSWREQRAGRELPYYILAAQGTLNGIETALDRARQVLQKGQTLFETDVEQYLYAAYQEYRTAKALTVSFQPYFTVLHTGDRTRRPNLPQVCPIDAGTKTLKIDSGIWVIDGHGLLRGVSDLCRTLVLDQASQEIYEHFDKTMTDTTIPAAVPGKDGEFVYLEGVKPLIPLKEKLAAYKIMPDKVVIPDDYKRNIGHVVGKQEPATIGFEMGNRDVLKEGMIGCVEYQWPFYPYAIGVEDMFYIDHRRTINITR